MNNCLVFAFVSMFFAGFTSVIAKKGLSGISGDLGVTVRTCFVFLFMLGFAWFSVPHKAWAELELNSYEVTLCHSVHERRQLPGSHILWL